MIISNNISYSHSTPCVVALGCFDGIHIGHAAVINKAISQAKEMGIPSCIWSFAEPPRRFYNPDSAPLLTLPEQKEKIISDLGADIYVSVEFTEQIATISPNDFVENILIKNLNAVCIVCGYDFSFGAGGKGTTQTLKKICDDKQISLITLPPVHYNSIPVSSSSIREFLIKGQADKAAELLGRPYAIISTVVSGKHLGRDLGFPTINQAIDKKLCIPAYGVYFTKITLKNTEYFGITNVGTQPTVCGKEVVCETNIFDFSENVYGEKSKVEFLNFIRAEKKFSSVEELKEQVFSDIETARKMIKSIC